MEKIGSSIYIYIGGELFASPQVSSALSEGYAIIGQQSAMDAQTNALKIMIGINNVSLTVDDITTTPAQLGENAALYIGIAGLVILALTFIVMFAVYKHLGLLANMVIAFFVAFEFLILSVIPAFQLSLASLLGILTSYLLMILSIVLIFQNIKKEFKTGKKIPISVKFAFKTSLVTVLDILAAILAGALILLLFGTSIVEGFIMPIIMGVLLTAILSLVILKFLINIYLKYNSLKYRKFGFNKEEIVEDENK